MPSARRGRRPPAASAADAPAPDLLIAPAHALTVRAYAKVNLSLEVLGRRPDGFHDIVSVTQLISLHDDVTASPSGSLVVETAPPVVRFEENLARRAAEQLAASIGVPPAVRVHITKRIPLAAGLGGGSSDTAATLRLLARLWHHPSRQAALATIAAGLGSDIPLFLGAGTSLIEGRGDRVTPLPAPESFWLALACPEVGLAHKTQALYAALSPASWSDGARVRTLADRLRRGQPVAGQPLVNAFDAAARATYPSFDELRSNLADAAGTAIHLTGAGPSLFAVVSSRHEAETAARQMRKLGVPTHVARTVAGRARIRRVRPDLGAPA